MSARDDYPVLALWPWEGKTAEVMIELDAALDEIDRLRRTVEDLVDEGD